MWGGVGAIIVVKGAIGNPSSQIKFKEQISDENKCQGIGG